MDTRSAFFEVRTEALNIRMNLGFKGLNVESTIIIIIIIIIISNVYFSMFYVT
jgi:hypothetical protein